MVCFRHFRLSVLAFLLRLCYPTCHVSCLFFDPMHTFSTISSQIVSETSAADICVVNARNKDVERRIGGEQVYIFDFLRLLSSLCLSIMILRALDWLRSYTPLFACCTSRCVSLLKLKSCVTSPSGTNIRRTNAVP